MLKAVRRHTFFWTLACPSAAGFAPRSASLVSPSSTPCPLGSTRPEKSISARWGRKGTKILKLYRQPLFIVKFTHGNPQNQSR
ncbi:MAG: hypothetical protein WAP51_01235, partial [Candidatus Sungiibacteriota bacterium]